MTPGVPFPSSLCAHDAQVIGAVADVRSRLSNELKSVEERLAGEVAVAIARLTDGQELGVKAFVASHTTLLREVEKVQSYQIECLKGLQAINAQLHDLTDPLYLFRLWLIGLGRWIKKVLHVG